MKQFKIRASACGQIMTNDRSGKGMGKTAQTYCETWLKEQIYGRRKEITTKYMTKGIVMEDDGIDMVNRALFSDEEKNTQYFENDIMTGTPDLIMQDIIVDVKCSWSFDTFPLFDTEIPTKDYIYQLQVYMELTGRKQAKLAYCLTDTPSHLIGSEARRYAYANGFDCDDELIAMFEAKMTYGDIDEKYKIRIFDIAYDPAIIESITERVGLCREYIQSLMQHIK